jgi:hypothetical protein
LWLGSKIILSGTRDSLKKDTFLLRGRGLCLAFFNFKHRASRKTVIYKCKIEENSLAQTDPKSASHHYFLMAGNTTKRSFNSILNASVALNKRDNSSSKLSIVVIQLWLSCQKCVLYGLELQGLLKEIDENDLSSVENMQT